MGFLDDLPPDTHARLDAASTLVHLEAGQWLVRRGDVGGDIYRLEEGTLEVLDPGTGPEAILALLEPGAVVGEVSFLDHSPRTADVRARLKSRIRRWAREDLRRLMQDDPSVAARLLESLARTVAKRMRSVSEAARRAPRDSSLGDTAGQLLADVDAMVLQAKELLDRADVALRARPHDPNAAATVRQAMDRLEDQIAAAFADTPTGKPAKEAMRRLRRELRPWIVRSHLGEACLREFGETTVTPAVLEHALADVAKGEGPFGGQLDRWLLDRPTLVARRANEPQMISQLLDRLPDRHLRVALLDTPAPRRLKAIKAHLQGRTADLVVVDPSRGVLTNALAQLGDDPTLATHAVQESPVRLAMGRSKEVLPPLEAMLLGEVPSYLPERVVVSLFAYARTAVRARGVVVAVGTEETRDETLLARLLAWPTIRRTATHTAKLAAQAGLEVQTISPTEGPGYVLLLRVPASP